MTNGAKGTGDIVRNEFIQDWTTETLRERRSLRFGERLFVVD